MNAKMCGVALLFAMIFLYFGCMDGHGPFGPFRTDQEYPGTKVLHGICLHKNQSGEDVMDTIYFDDGIPDTLPYNSRLYLYYYGYSSGWDSVFYKYPQMEMRYQFRYWRQGTSIDGGPGGTYERPWYPIAGAEDTRCHTNVDETYMRVGTYDYIFMVRSFDEEYNADATPDSIRFVGNFPPVIDEVLVGYDAAPFSQKLDFVPFAGDTLCFGLDNTYQFRPDTASAHQVVFSESEMIYTYYFKIILIGSGHDDPRDMPGSGIEGWKCSMRGVEEHDFGGEDEWIYDSPPNELEHELHFQVDVPLDTVTFGPDFSIINDPPDYLGQQELAVAGVDIHPDEIFLEGIRGTSPEFDPDDPCTVINPGLFLYVMRRPYRSARRGVLVKNVYLKLVR